MWNHEITKLFVSRVRLYKKKTHFQTKTTFSFLLDHSVFICNLYHTFVYGIELNGSTILRQWWRSNGSLKCTNDSDVWHWLARRHNWDLALDSKSSNFGSGRAQLESENKSIFLFSLEMYRHHTKPEAGNYTSTSRLGRANNKCWKDEKKHGLCQFSTKINNTQCKRNKSCIERMDNTRVPDFRWLRISPICSNDRQFRFAIYRWINKNNWVRFWVRHNGSTDFDSNCSVRYDVVCFSCLLNSI